MYSLSRSVYAKVFVGKGAMLLRANSKNLKILLEVRKVMLVAKVPAIFALKGHFNAETAGTGRRTREENLNSLVLTFVQSLSG